MMKMFTKSLLLLFFTLPAILPAFAQAPNITYATPQIYKPGSSITPLVPTNTGGAVASGQYGTVGTYAGSGQYGYTDGALNAASFKIPTGLAVDPENNIYISDFSNHVIRRILSQGDVTTYAGNGSTGRDNGAGSQSSFYNPSGMALAPDGTLYIVDETGNDIRKINSAGYVLPFAGSGLIGKADGNGPLASFNRPVGIAIDADGNLFVSDLGNHLIRKITPDADVSVYAGNSNSVLGDGPRLQAGFGGPMGLTVDSKGNVFVCDNYNYTIRKIAKNGDVSTFAGSGNNIPLDGTGTAAGFMAPIQITVDANDNLYVSDGNLIRKITPQGVVTTVAGSTEPGAVNGIGTNARFYTPSGLAFDNFGVLYVSEVSNNLIRQITLNGYFINKKLPEGLVFDSNTGTISGTPAKPWLRDNYIITARNNSGSSTATVVIEIDAVTAPPPNFPPAITYPTPQTYTVNKTITPLMPTNTGGIVPPANQSDMSVFAGTGEEGKKNGPGSVATFNVVNVLTTTAAGNVMVIDAGNALIRKITPDGVVSTFAGNGVQATKDGLGTVAGFKAAGSIVEAPNGDFYISEFNGNVIRKMTAGAQVTTIAGNGTFGYTDGKGNQAGFNYAGKILLNKNGDMFVSDAGNHAIRKVTPDGTVTTFAGNGTKGFTNGNGKAASFNFPGEMVFDMDGNILVFDTQNNALRKITPAGDVTTVAVLGQPGKLKDLQYISGMAMDNAGDIYISDETQNKIFKLDTKGVLTWFAGNGYLNSGTGPLLSASIGAPRGLAFDKQGNLFVTEAEFNKIRKIASYGYTIDKTLPAGLIFNPMDGTISGTPTAVSAAQDYTVTARNGYGAGNAILRIEVRDVTLPPPNIRYSSPKIYTANSAIAPLAPINTGGEVEPNGYSIDKPLPAGLIFDSADGTISGTPTVVADRQDYTVTARNGSGSSSTTISITVIYGSPSATLPPKIDYASPKIYTINSPIAPLAPSNTGGDVEPNGYSIDKPLPAGLVFDKNTGVISGTPTALSPATIYTVVAKNAAGPNQAIINIKISDEVLFIAPPPDISYTTPQTLYRNTLVNPILPVNNGGAVLRYSNGLLNVFAGTGSPGRTDGPKASAKFESPVKLTIDGQGNSYVTDLYNYSVRKITPGGIVSTIAGAIGPGYANGALGTSQLQGPRGIVTDKAGNVYVADLYSIRKITPAGITSTLAGSSVAGYADGTGTAAKFDAVLSLAIDGSDNIYAVDQGNNLIRRITPAGVVTTIAGNSIRANTDGQGTAATFNNPQDIIFNKGNFYIADYLTIRKMTPGGLVITIAGNGAPKVLNGPAMQGGFGNASAIGINAAGDIYVLDIGNNAPNEGNAIVRLIDKDNNLSTVNLMDATGTKTYLSTPNGITFDKNGLIYVVSGSNYIETLSFDRYTIDRALPAGLIFDTGTGQISGTPTVLSAESTYTITAYNSGGPSVTTITLQVVPNEVKAPGVITFPPFAANPVWDASNNIDPRVTSSQTETPIVLSSSNPAVVTINADNTLHIISAGEAIITATQAGNDNYLPSDAVARTIIITRANPVTSFPAISEKTACDADFSVAGTSTNSSSPIVYTSSNTAVATVSASGMVHIVGAGTTEIRASQAQSALYNAVADVVRQLVVTATNSQIPAPTVAISTPSVKVYENERVTFTATTSGTPASYQWKVNGNNAGSNASTFSTATVVNNDEITCTITFTNRCILPVSSNAITITVLPRPVAIVPPNTFTPNGDGINDTWKIPALFSYPNCSVSIFSRNGALLILSRGYSKAWDGTYKGKALPAGVYYYIITPGDGQAVISGNVTILR